MLSKEEIEKVKKWLNWCKKEEVFLPYTSNILQYIQELEADNYECNNIINNYIEERHNLIDIMKADRMEQLDDYVIYLIEKYLKELGALEDE